jgi:hypothetical protein
VTDQVPLLAVSVEPIEAAPLMLGWVRFARTDPEDVVVGCVLVGCVLVGCVLVGCVLVGSDVEDAGEPAPPPPPPPEAVVVVVVVDGVVVVVVVVVWPVVVAAVVVVEWCFCQRMKNDARLNALRAITPVTRGACCALVVFALWAVEPAAAVWTPRTVPKIARIARTIGEVSLLRMPRSSARLH